MKKLLMVVAVLSTLPMTSFAQEVDTFDSNTTVQFIMTSLKQVKLLHNSSSFEGTGKFMSYGTQTNPPFSNIIPLRVNISAPQLAAAEKDFRDLYTQFFQLSLTNPDSAFLHCRFRVGSSVNPLTNPNETGGINKVETTVNSQNGAIESATITIVSSSPSFWSPDFCEIVRGNDYPFIAAGGGTVALRGVLEASDNDVSKTE
jgi:hypothetical protein